MKYIKSDNVIYYNSLIATLVLIIIMFGPDELAMLFLPAIIASVIVIIVIITISSFDIYNRRTYRAAASLLLALALSLAVLARLGTGTNVEHFWNGVRFGLFYNTTTDHEQYNCIRINNGDIFGTVRAHGFLSECRSEILRNIAKIDMCNKPIYTLSVLRGHGPQIGEIDETWDEKRLSNEFISVVKCPVNP